MQPGEPRLAINYGADSTRAVLAWPDGRWQPLSFDGAMVLSSAVHTSGPLVGQAAWRHAASDPDGLVVSPMAGIADDAPAAGELTAATLRHVAAEAARATGGPVADVRMVVPAGWGPRRRTWLRQAAHRAGLGQPRLVEAPVAAADRLLTVGVQVPVGAFLLFCDLGAGCEATVLRRGPAGFEVLATVADTQAGARGIDDRLLAALTDTAPDSAQRWATRAALRTAREQLSTQTVVTVPMPPPVPPMVLHSRIVDEIAEPVLKQAADLAVQAVTAADLTVDQLTGVYLIGGAAVTPAAPQVIGAVLGATPVAVTEPGIAAVLGAAGADTGVPASAPAPAAAVPPVRRLSAILLPGVASLALYGHMVFTATFHNGTPDRKAYGYYVLATWAELTTAAVFALIASLAAGSLFGAALTQSLHRDGAPAPRTLRSPGGQVAGGIAVALACGLAVAALYGVAAAVYFGLPVSGLLRWALLPTLPTAVIAAALAWLAARRHVTPPRGWDGLLTFPTGSVCLTAVGTALLAMWWHGPAPAVLSGSIDIVGRAGGVLVGAGIAWAVVRHPALRAGLAAFLALFGFLLVGAGGVSILAVAYAIAVTVWWAYRLWLVARLPTHPGHG
jgi:hypothetical protein